jgi:hypothetical protein
MRMFFVIFLILSAFGISNALAYGNGTVDLTDLDGVLRQKSALLDRVRADFDIFRVGDARMITREENLKLNGRRIGPYMFYARPKGSSGPYTYEVRIDTQPIFYDRANHKVPMLGAFDVKEELTGISIRPLSSSSYFTPLPGQ